MILLDATALALLLNKEASPPLDPTTKKPVERAHSRFRYLEKEVQRRRDTIVIPTPALAEILVKAGDEAGAILERLNKSSFFKIAPFDQRAAVEVAAMTRDAIRAGDKRAGLAAPYQKIKVDRQIVAIGRSLAVSTIYSDDTDILAIAGEAKLPVMRTWEMPLPPEDPQGQLFEGDLG